MSEKIRVLRNSGKMQQTRPHDSPSPYPSEISKQMHMQSCKLATSRMYSSCYSLGRYLVGESVSVNITPWASLLLLLRTRVRTHAAYAPRIHTPEEAKAHWPEAAATAKCVLPSLLFGAPRPFHLISLPLASPSSSFTVPLWGLPPCRICMGHLYTRARESGDTRAKNACVMRA